MNRKTVIFGLVFLISLQVAIPSQAASVYYGDFLHNNLLEQNGIVRKYIVNNWTSATLFDDDGTAFWTLTKTGSGSFDYTASLDTVNFKSGVNSYLVTKTAGAFISASALKQYSPTVDFSTFTNLELWYYGANDANVVHIVLWCPNYANRYHYQFTDNFNGWHFFNLTYPGSMSAIGSPVKSTIGAVEFYSMIDTIRMDQLITRNYPVSYYEVWDGSERVYVGLIEPDINDFIPYNTEPEIAFYIGFGLFALFIALGFFLQDSDAAITHAIAGLVGIVIGVTQWVQDDALIGLIFIVLGLVLILRAVGKGLES